jgi:L-rhamnose isomerase
MPINTRFDALISRGLDYLKSSYGDAAVERAIDLTGRFSVEIPGWQVWAGFGGGGRFEGGGGGGAARTTEEIARDCGLIHKPCVPSRAGSPQRRSRRRGSSPGSSS